MSSTRRPCDLMLIAYDGSDNAKRAIQYAGRFLAADRAIVLTAWEPMVRQAARMSGLSGVMQPDWVPDEDMEDVAFADAKATNDEGLELAKAAGLNAESRSAVTLVLGARGSGRTSLLLCLPVLISTKSNSA